MKNKTKHAIVLSAAMICGTANGAVILDHNVERNDIGTTTVGTVTTAWDGWGGAGTAANNNYFNVLDLAVDNDEAPAAATALSTLDGAVPFQDAGRTAPITATFGGTIAPGTYVLSLQVVNWGNFGFPNVAVDFAGLTADSSITVAPIAEQDEIWTYTYTVAAGDAEIGNDLSLGVSLTTATGNSRDNFGIDHVVIDFTAVPEPSSAVLALFGALGLIRRRR